MGPVELQLGLAAAALGHLDAAVADLEAAVSICDANGACGYAVQAPVELAAVLARRRPGDLSRARAALDRSGGRGRRLGMVPFTERIEQLRARLPARRRPGSPLSPRELEVARLVARGLTNKQIGEALFVSERTAENHVQHILVKLGFSNRSQIAVVVRSRPNEYSAEYFPGWPDPGLFRSVLPASAGADRAAVGKRERQDSSWHYIHISSSKGRTIENFRMVSAKHNPPQDIDGLLAWAAGSDEVGLHVVTVWQSKAHQERWAAEQLFPAFQAAGHGRRLPANTEFTEYEAGELYIR